jgi:proteasome lid subunit RPN8/RPN11
MTLQITRAQMAQVEAAAIAQYPQECCGLLLGTTASAAGTQPVTQIWPTENAWSPAVPLPDALANDPIAENPLEPLETEISETETSETSAERKHDKGDRFWIAPSDLFAAQKFARSQAWEIIGVYHSHPDCPAVPSECDRQSAWPGYHYLILSVVAQPETNRSPKNVAPQIAASHTWVLDEQNHFQPERLEILA